MDYRPTNNEALLCSVQALGRALVFFFKSAKEIKSVYFPSSSNARRGVGAIRININEENAMSLWYLPTTRNIDFPTFHITYEDMCGC